MRIDKICTKTLFTKSHFCTRKKKSIKKQEKKLNLIKKNKKTSYRPRVRVRGKVIVKIKINPREIKLIKKQK